MFELVVKILVGGLLAVWGIEIVAGLGLIVYAARGPSKTADEVLEPEDQSQPDQLSPASSD